MYCSTNDGYNQLCNNVDNNPIRISHAGLPGLEDLFYMYGVDLQFYAHEHSYERLWPVYNKQVKTDKIFAFIDISFLSLFTNENIAFRMIPL